MTPQLWPMYGAGTSGTRQGKLYVVLGWLPMHDEAPELGMLPVIVPIDGGGVAIKYDPERGIVRLHPDLPSAQAAAEKAAAARRA